MHSPRRIYKWAALLLAACLLLASCGAQTTETDLPNQTAEEQPEENAVPGSIEITGEAAAELTEGQKTVITALMERYYQSMGRLEVQDCAALFADEEQAEMHRQVWSLLCEIRGASLSDLTLRDYAVTLDCTAVEPQEDGTVRVSTEETTVMHFAASPAADSTILGMYQGFVLEGSEETGWKIKRHVAWDSAYYPFMRFVARDNGLSEGTKPPIEVGYSTYEEQRTIALENLAARLAQQGEQAEAMTARGSYDRAAAVAYARRWAGERNSEWAEYDRYGGNCMNYVSQAINAGGVPMDTTGSAWYWFGNGNRTASWSGVNYFASYVAANTGSGLVGDVETPYYTGEAGDVIAMGNDRFRHIVMISEVLTDEAGNTVDYLICSNTGDLRDFPAGAYFYAYQQLIKIYGWN